MAGDALPFPIKVRFLELAHRGETKSYHMVVLSSANEVGPAVLIKRWGKVQTWGSTDLVRYTDGHRAITARDKQARQKEKRGYEVKDSAMVIVETRSELERQIGQKTGYDSKYMELLTAGEDEDNSALMFLFGIAESSGYEVVRPDDDDDIVSEPPAPKASPKPIENAIGNKSWGMF